ncbi:MAG: hypothetical protein IJS45_03230 [Clostridia bacterium]|nr:hypothetical protein [Clostridia bacterium]
MKHLTKKEILDFLNVSSFDAGSSAAVKRVNCHIVECSACAAKVKSAVKYHDAVAAISKEDYSREALTVSEYDVDKNEVAAAAKELFETKTSVTRI